MTIGGVTALSMSKILTINSFIICILFKQQANKNVRVNEDFAVIHACCSMNYPLHTVVPNGDRPIDSQFLAAVLYLSKP